MHMLFPEFGNAFIILHLVAFVNPFSQYFGKKFPLDTIYCVQWEKVEKTIVKQSAQIFHVRKMFLRKPVV